MTKRKPGSNRPTIATGVHRRPPGAQVPDLGMKWPEVLVYVKRLSRDGLNTEAIWGELAMREHYRPSEYGSERLVPYYSLEDVKRALKESK